MSDQIDVVFVNPPSPDGSIYIRDIDRSGRYSRESTIWPQANLAYLAAYMDDMYSVDVVDCIAERMDWQKFEKYLISKNPKYVVTNVISSIASNDVKVADIAKRINAKTIAIGPHVTALPDETLTDYPNLDCLIVGEAEATLRELIDKLQDGGDLADVKGVGYRKHDGRIVVNEKRPPIQNLDNLPYPRHDLLPLERYRLPFVGKKYSFVMTSRGCPYECTFCRSPVMWGRQVRKRSPENIIGELRQLERLGVYNVVFHSDTFTVDKKWTIDLCNRMIEEKLNTRWITNSRADTVDVEMLQWMKRAGCWMIAYGFESGSQEVLDNVKKGITIDQIRNAAKWTDEVGMKVWGYFIIGLPGETVDTIRQTIELSKELPLYLANFAIGAPYPGTEFHKYVRGKGWLVATSWEDYDQSYSAVVSYENLSCEEILAGMRRAYKEWYLKPKQIIRYIRAIRSTDDLRVLVQTGVKHLGMMYGRQK